MNKDKLKKICVDAFEEVEQDAFVWVREQYINKVAQLLEEGLNPINHKRVHTKHTKMSIALRSLFEESFDVMKEKKNEKSS